jgi:alkylation response protein AidB-like acyl-CoA dehydrogenase
VDSAAELEKLFGDPFESTNPVGFAAILEADERAEMFARGEALLDEFGLGAEFVPQALGGRLRRLDELVEVMRSVYRRDPSLGLGYGASSFISGVNVWTVGDADQRRRVADLLLGNGRVAAAYHELAHGNDMAGAELTATPVVGGWSVNGRKEVVTNLRRAEALVVFARTGSGSPSRSHSQLLVEKSSLPPGRIRYLPRFGTVGLRGVQLGRAEFVDCPVGTDGMLGREGQGLETAMRSFQITRTVLPAMATSVLDSALAVTLRHVRGRRLYGAAVSELPHVRAVLASAFADLLMCEAVSLVAARSIHLLPREASVYAAAVKYAVSGAMLRAVDRLSTVLGAEFYQRANVFQKLLRDLKPIGFGHAARAACQTTILPQLGMAARRPLQRGDDVPAALFELDADLPPIPFDSLTITARGRDPLGASLPALANEWLPDATLREHLAHFASELETVRDECARLAPHDLTITADPYAYDLVARYVKVLVATSCARMWWHNRESDTFLANPVWPAAVLTRLRTGGGRVEKSLPEGLTGPLFAELLDRHDTGRGFGLLARRLYGE